MNHGWEKKKIEELCVPKKGILRASVKYKAEDIIEYVDISSIDRNSHQISHTSNYIFKDAPSRAQQVIVRNDILLSLVRPNLKNIACVSLDNSNLIASSGFCVLRSFGTLPRFLLYVITNDCFTDKLVAKCAGAAYPAVREEDVRSILIPVPPMEVQAQIVSELDKINELIAVKRSQLKDLDALAQSLFYETFGEPIAPPKGWNTKVWSDLFDTILGKMLDKNKQIETDIQLPYLANQNVQWGYFDLSKLNTMSFTQNEVAKFRLKEGDILICEGGESGRCAIWKGADYTILFQKAIHRARIKDRNIINPYFVRFWLEIFKKNDGLKNHLTKATIEHLTGAKLKTVNVPVPPIALQEQFAARIEAIEAQKKLVEASIADLETLLASRMDYWFND